MLKECYTCEGTGVATYEYDDMFGETESYEGKCCTCGGTGYVEMEYKKCSQCNEVHLLEVESEDPLCDNCLDKVMDTLLKHIEFEEEIELE